MVTIMPAFKDFPEEGKLIGRLLAGYGELELVLCGCVAEARNDFNAVFKAMFRPRGETQRIDIADALGRELFQTAKLGTPFEQAVANTHYCRRIRNQYAHCYWTANFGRCLGFAELEGLAKQNGAVAANMMLGQAKDIDLPTLEAQEAFFVFVNNCLVYLLHEYRVRAGSRTKNPFASPKIIPQPPFCKP
jgi:hypothetical protein